jgi:hypothetical protein
MATKQAEKKKQWQEASRSLEVSHSLIGVPTVLLGFTNRQTLHWCTTAKPYLAL